MSRCEGITHRDGPNRTACPCSSWRGDNLGHLSLDTRTAGSRDDGPSQARCLPAQELDPRCTFPRAPESIPPDDQGGGIFGAEGHLRCLSGQLHFYGPLSNDGGIGAGLGCSGGTC